MERVFDGAYRHREKVEAIVKTDAEELIELGEKEGERRGLQKGLEALWKGILTALSLRFGPAPEPSLGKSRTRLLRSLVLCRGLQERRPFMRMGTFS
jgi:hypothetical protein